MTAPLSTGRRPASRSGRLRCVPVPSCAAADNAPSRHHSTGALDSVGSLYEDGPATLAASGQHRDPGVGRPRVIVVEDDPFVRYELVALLGDEGVEVTGEADNGAAAVSLAVQRFPDVVLMDLRMPGMGGIEATRAIKAVLPRTQVVLLSAYDDPGLHVDGYDAGAYAYLVKGCPAGRIVDAVHEAWELKRGLDRQPDAR